MASSRYVLAVDLGGGGPKVAVVSERGDILAHAHQPVETFLLPDGGAEQDAEQWWWGVVSGARKVIRDSGVPTDDIVAVSCTTQWSVIVPVDENGQPLMRAVYWLDTRGGPYNRRITRGFPSIQGYGVWKLWRWIRLTGLAPTHSGVDSLGHILFIKNQRPDIYDRTYKFLEPMDFLTFKLTGRCTATQATMVPLLVVDNNEWSCLHYNDKLLRLAGLDGEKLPELLPNDSEVGTLSPSAAGELGLRPTTRVMAGTNDTHASAIGAGAVRDFEGVIYIGTSVVLTCHLPFKRTDVRHMMATMPSPLKGRYLLLAEQGVGGKDLEHFLKNVVYAEDEFNTGLMPDDVFQRANRVAGGVEPGSGGVIFLPWLSGSLAPEENALVRGGFFNLSLNTTRSHMTRSIFEGIAYNNRWTREAAEGFIKRRFESFRFAGGGALSELWAQIHADVLGVPILRVVRPEHTTIRGAAFFAFNRLGLCSLDDISERVGIDGEFEPDQGARRTYDRLYKQFRSLYRRNRRIFEELNAR